MAKEKEKIDREELLGEIQRVARIKGKNKITLSEFSSESGISRWQIYQLFDSWSEACKLAGLDLHYQHITIEDNTLFEEMYRVFVDLGGLCNRTKFGRLCDYSVDTYKRRFGKWGTILLSFRKWIEQEEIDFPYLDELPIENEIKKIENKNNTSSMNNSDSTIQSFRTWDRLGKITYGPYLNFRGLQHAPINEQGVVFLFGMICRELGFVVESVQTGFPDCEAKRCVDKKSNKLERVRIEFEYESKNFKGHGHNPQLCDLIVCWVHNWDDCPLEVIELKSIITSLKNDE